MKLSQINKYKVHKISNFLDITYHFFMKIEDFTKLSHPKHIGMLIYYTFTLKFKYYNVIFEGNDPNTSSCSSWDVMNP